MQMSPPPHGFPASEYERRLAGAQRVMSERGLDALVVTSPPNVRYFTGFETQFWESPTRPWYVIVPREGPLTAAFPALGVPALTGLAWIGRVESWPAPRPEDDGVSLVAGLLAGLPRRFGRVGWEFGREMLVRAPRIDVDAMTRASGVEFADGAPALWALRAVKSEGEVARIAHACAIAGRAFDRLPGSIGTGHTARRVTREMAMALLEEGADHVPFLACVAGPGGYQQIIAGPSDRPIEAGDVLIVDTGATFDGYFCDFDRNYAFGDLGDAARRAQEIVWDATEAGIKAARPGTTMADVFQAMARVLEPAGSLGNNVGRMGHGLGLQLTEPPSVMAEDPTPLGPGMVITIEPGMEYAPGRMIVHEENVVVTDDGCRLLTERAPKEMWRVG